MKKPMFIKKRHIKTTRKVLGIVKNDITGIEYGIVEIPTTAEIIVPSPKHKKIKGKKNNGTKKKTRTKKENVEQQTKPATKTVKVRYSIRATLVCPYHYRPTKKQSDWRKKYHAKATTLLKKKQRNEKIKLQNIEQDFSPVIPIFDCIQLVKAIQQNTK